jgi:hypothetical protein
MAGMKDRLTPLLTWQSRYDVRRATLFFVGAAYLLIAGPCLYWLFNRTGAAGFPLITGSQVFTALTFIHCILSPGFAWSRACRTVDDRRAGILAFLKIGDMSPRRWVAFRLLGLVQSFLPIWVLRFPLYVFAFHLGGLRVEKIIVAELFQWVSFLFAGSVSLAVARLYQTPQAARIVAMGVIVGFEFMLIAPLRVLRGLEAWLGSSFSAGLALWEPLAEGVSRVSLFSQNWWPPIVSSDWPLSTASIGLHFTVGGAALMTLVAGLYAGVEEESPPSSAMRKARSLSRPSRRAGRDALAWQAYAVHADGGQTVRRKAIIYGMGALFLIGLSLSPNWALPTFATISALIALSAAAFRPGDCLARELKDGTLSTLALLPYEGREIFNAWRRGARRLAVPDLLWAALCFAVLAKDNPEAIPIWTGLYLTLLLATPFFFVNNLVQFDWKYLPLGCLSTFVIVALTGACIGVGVEANSYLGLALFTIFAAVVHAIFLRQIPRWFLKRLESLS